MASTVFVEIRFWLLMVSSIVAPLCIYVVLMRTRAVSRMTVLLFGVALVAMAGIDVYLLQGLSRLAKISESLADDAIFASELSVGLYVLPVLFGGIGVNMISHVLVSHLTAAEKKFDDARRRKGG
jgi:hypothetical protein